MDRSGVRVVARVQPPETPAPASPPAVRLARVEHNIGPSVVQLWPSGEEAPASELAFDACFAFDAALFEAEVAPLVTHALAGGNAAALVLGTEATVTLEDAASRCLARLLSAEEAPSVELAHVEVDAERVRDLLTPPSSKRAELPIRQLMDGAVTVNGLSRRRVTTVREGEELYDAGRRHAAASRGHNVLIVYVTTTDLVSGAVRCGKLHLVDVALSGGVKNSMSLFVLGKVAAALNAGDAQRVSFRESKLTRLMQDSLGGDSRALMICSVSPSSSMYQDSLHALTFASKARGVPSGIGIRSLKANAPAPEVASMPAAAARPDASGNGRLLSLLSKANTSVTLDRRSARVSAVDRQQEPEKSSASKRASVGASESMESKLAAWRARKSGGGDTKPSTATPSSGSHKSNRVSPGLKRRATVPIGDSKLTPTPSLRSMPTPWSKATINHTSPSKPGTPASHPSMQQLATSTRSSDVGSAPITPDASKDRPESAPDSPTSATTSESISAESTAVPVPKKARLIGPSEQMTPVVAAVVRPSPTPSCEDSKARAVVGVTSKAPLCTGSPASDKENQPVPETGVRYDQASCKGSVKHSHSARWSTDRLLACLPADLMRSRCLSRSSSSRWRSTSRRSGAFAVRSVCFAARTACCRPRT